MSWPDLPCCKAFTLQQELTKWHQHQSLLIHCESSKSPLFQASFLESLTVTVVRIESKGMEHSNGSSSFDTPFYVTKTRALGISFKSSYLLHFTHLTEGEGA